MANKRSRLEAKKKSLFTNRISDLAIFRKFVSSADDNGLLHVMGIAGIGKTALLEAFGRICNEEQIPWILASVGDQALPVQLIRFIYDKLRQFDGSELPGLRVQFELYEELDHLVRNSPEMPPDVLGVILTGIFKPTQESIKDAEQGADQALGHLSRLLGEEVEFYLNPVSRFTKALTEDLAEVSTKRPICLMFDRYEQISTFLDDWIRAQLFPKLEDNVYVVTSGRKPMPEQWLEWLPIVHVLELNPLSTEDTKVMVRLRGINNEKSVAQIANFADGLPLAAGVAVDLLKEIGTSQLEMSGIIGYSAIVNELVKKLTEEASPELRNWLEQCAIVRWFNEDTLEQFIGIPRTEITEVYSRLSRLSVVRPHQNGLVLHDLVREFIGEDIVRRSKRRYTELHQKATDYYTRLSSEARLQESQPLTVESVYHLLRTDVSAGMVRLRDLFENAADFSQPDFSAALLETTNGLELQSENKLWKEYLEAMLGQQKNVDNLKSAQLLEDLISRPEIELYPELKTRIAAYLSMALWYVAQYEPALRYAEVGIKLSEIVSLPKMRNRALEALGLTYNRLGRFGEGIATQIELLSVAKQSNDQIGQAWALNNLGYFSWHAGKWTEAERYLRECQTRLIEMRSPYNVVYPLCHLGLIYAAVGRLSDAESVLTESIRICREERNIEITCKTLENLSDLHMLQGRLEESLKDIDQALEISHAMVHPYYDTDSLRRRGDVLVAMGHIYEAISVYLASLQLAQNLGAKYLEVRILAALLKLKVRGWNVALPIDEKQISELCYQMGYYHVLSDLKSANAVASFLGDDIDTSQRESLQSLVLGMQFNRYWLYNKLAYIIELTKEWKRSGKSEQCHQLLNGLLSHWENDTHENQSLLEFETKTRIAEPGLVPLPLGVNEQLRQAIQLL